MPRFIPKLFLTILTFIFSRPAYACSVCFGDPKSLHMQGVKWGIIALLLVLAVVLALFTLFFIDFKKRASTFSKH